MSTVPSHTGLYSKWKKFVGATAYSSFGLIGLVSGTLELSSSSNFCNHTYILTGFNPLPTNDAYVA